MCELTAVVQEREIERPLHKGVAVGAHMVGPMLSQKQDVRKRGELMATPNSLAFLSGFQEGSVTHRDRVFKLRGTLGHKIM